MLDPDLLLAHEQGVAGQRAHGVAPMRKPASSHMPMASHRAGRRLLGGGEPVWMLSQSAKRAFGCHERRCFANNAYLTTVLTCYSLLRPIHRDGTHGMVVDRHALAVSPNGASKTVPIAPRQAQKKFCPW